MFIYASTALLAWGSFPSVTYRSPIIIPDPGMTTANARASKEGRMPSVVFHFANHPVDVVRDARADIEGQAYAPQFSSWIMLRDGSVLRLIYPI